MLIVKPGRSRLKRRENNIEVELNGFRWLG
jgi:hypothetical protein